MWFLGLVVLSTNLELLIIQDDVITKDDLKSRFLSEGPQSWHILSEPILNFEGSIVEEYVLLNRVAQNRVRRLHYKLIHDRGLKLVELSLLPSSVVGNATGMNPRYSFGVSRSSESAAESDPFHVYAFSTDTDSGPGHTLSIYQSYLEVSYRIGSMTLDSIVNHPEFELRDIRAVDHNGRAMVRVEFTRSTKNEPPYKYWAILNPDECWAVYQCQEHVSWGTITYTVEYGSSFDGVPFPSKMVFVDADQSGQSVNEHHMSYDEPKKCDAPSKQFTLGAYGLPEPGSAGGGGSWLTASTLFAIGGVLGLSGGIVLWIVSRIRKT